MSRLSIPNRRRLVQIVLSRPLETSDYWEYAVSNAWISAWSSDTVGQHGSLTESCSVPFDGEQRSTDMHSVALTMSNNDSENKYLPETTWRMLTSWFGIHPKHLLRRRPIYFSYMNLAPIKDPFGRDYVVADRELDSVPVWVGDINDILLDKYQNVVEVFAWDSFEHIQKQVTRSVYSKLSSSSKLRFWFGIKRIDNDIVLEPIFELKQLLISRLIQLMPEVKRLMKKRNLLINPKYANLSSTQYKGVKQRIPLGEDIFATFSEDVPQLCIAIEEVGVLDKGATDVIGEESEFESIVALASIRNEWDDMLTTVLAQHTENTARSSQALQDELITSAKQIVGDKLAEISEIKSDYEKRFAALEERENTARIKENENNEKELELKNRLSMFKKGLDDFQLQKKKLMDDMKRIEGQNKISESRVTLNIGGILYTTSIATLTKEENSLFAVMFSGQHALKREPDGTYFVDRDGVNFRFVLNYLRDGEASIETIPNETRIIREVIREAKHYQLANMEVLLEKKLCEME